MIIIPKRELIIPAHINMGMKGFLRLRTINKFSGKCRIDTGWFPNKILDSGKNIMNDRSDWMDNCQVGTDNTAPTALQTGLLGHHAGTATIVSTTNATEGGAPYFGWKQRVFRFPAGSVAANLSEAGVGWGTSGSTLISRALILDPDTQTPTTITPLIDEMLEVSYELRYYPPLVDVTSPSVTLDGVVYDTVTRAANVTHADWSERIGTAIGAYSIIDADWSAYDGAIGAITTGPSGVSAACDNNSQYDSAYSSNSYEIVMNSNCGSTGWNLGSGIRCIKIRTTAGQYQTSFTANPGGTTVPKTSSFTMTMAWTLGWSEVP